MASWQPLGLINPIVNQYVSWPIASVGGEVFRVTFLNLGPNPPARFRTYGWIDGQYFNGDRTQARKIYPSTEPQIITLPIPPDLVQAGIIVRYIRLQKKLFFRTGRVNEPLWTAYLEEFIGDPNTDPANFTINLF